MILQTMPSEFQKALPLLQQISSAGYEAYFVGGSVRDVLLGRPIHDIDIATNAYPEEIKQIFPRTVDIGIEHGTVLVLTDFGEYEVTTFRTEDTYVDYRRPSQVSFVRSLSEDLKRRDFTVNAFALDEQGFIIDQFDGLADLDNKLLRAVGVATERFNEDALRILRGLRFAASLGFAIEENTFSAMSACAHLLIHISIERSFIELDKLLTAPYWRFGFTALLASSVYRYLPDLGNKKENLEELLASLDANFIFDSSEQAWAYLIIKLGIDPKLFLKKWKTSIQFQREVTQLVTIYQFRQHREVTKRDVYDYGKNSLLLAEQLRRAEKEAVDYDRIESLEKTLPIHNKKEIVVNGSDLIKVLACQPGPQLGQLLSRVEMAIVEGRLLNDYESIMEFCRKEMR